MKKNMKPVDNTSAANKATRDQNVLKTLKLKLKEVFFSLVLVCYSVCSVER